MTNNTLVSIGLPVRNGERFLARAFETVTDQTHGDLQIVVSDNASSDATEDICREMQTRDPRIEYRRASVDVGYLENFNQVLTAARGDYFMWAAHDDIWEPTFVSRLLEALQRDPRSVLSFCAFDNVDEYERPVRTFPLLADLAADDHLQQMIHFISQDERLGKANLIYGLTRRQTLLDAGGFKLWGRGSWGADMLVVFRLLTTGRLAIVDDLLFHKRLLSESPGPSKAFNLAKDLLQMRGYLAGYRNILSEPLVPLGPTQRESLLAAVEVRRRAAYRSAVGKVRARFSGTDGTDRT